MKGRPQQAQCSLGMGSFDMDRVELDWGGLDWDMRVCVGVGMVGFTRHFQSWTHYTGGL